ncbi:MAG TPA: LLM class flavin-dependent oxidoreductase [Mesorhizobium sp.]
MHVEFTSLFEAQRAPHANAQMFPTTALLRHAVLLEDAEIDRLLIESPAHIASGSAAFAVIEHAPQLGALLPHRAGDVSPETAAEQFGLFDQLSRGRLAIKILPPSASAFEEKHDAHERALESLDEYLTVLKRLWASDDPFDFEGHHHRVVRGHVASKPFGKRQVPLLIGGLSGTAIKVAAKHADIFALRSAPVAELRQDIARVRNAAFAFGRADRLRFSLNVRPVIAATRQQAWAFSAALGPVDGTHGHPESRLVGTAEQVALLFINLVDLGVTDFILHGLQDEEQLRLFAEQVAPLVRNTALRQGARGIRELLSGTGAFGIYPTVGG